MIRYKVSLYESRPPEVTIRAWRELKRSGLRLIGEHWHAHMLPLHFAPNARYRYKYRPRTEKWRDRKRKLAERGEVKRGGEADLVASGLLEQALTQFATIRATPNKAKLQMNGPRYITMKPRSGKQPDKAAEATTILVSEAKILDDMLDEHMTTGINLIHEPLTTAL